MNSKNPWSRLSNEALMAAAAGVIGFNIQTLAAVDVTAEPGSARDIDDLVDELRFRAKL